MIQVMFTIITARPGKKEDHYEHLHKSFRFVSTILEV